MLKVGRALRLHGLFHLIEKFESPPTRDALSDEGREFWANWAHDLNELAAGCQSDPLMLYLLAAYTDYMIDAGKALAKTGHGLVWNGDTTEVLIRIMDNRVPLTEICEKIADGPKPAAQAESKDTEAGKGGWIA